MFKNFFKFTLLVSAAFICFSCGTKSDEPIALPESSEYVSPVMMKAPAGAPLLDPQMAGEEHNRALSFLVEKFDSRKDLTYDEIFEVWLDYANCRMSELGYPKFPEEDIKMYYKSLGQLNNYCNTQFVGDAVISYTKYLDELGIISKDFADFSLRSFSDIDFEKNDPSQIKEFMSKRISCLYKEDEILAQNMIGIAEYTTVYWDKYFVSKAPQKDGEEKKDEESEKKDDKEKTELKRRNDNVRDLCAACVDVLAGAGVASTGAGAIASGVVGAAGSFLLKEAMGW